MLSRPPLSAAVDESNADSAAATDVDDTAAAASAVDVSALAPFVSPGDGSPSGGLNILAWLISLLTPLIALMLVVLIGKSSILLRAGYFVVV